MDRVSSYRAKQLIVMRRDLKMRKGKIAAQAGHACVERCLWHSSERDA
jgi:PTH2 family peptidyl-tRNA hydrolase